MITFADLQALALRSADDKFIDTRPKWLTAMPSASDNTARYYRFFHHLVEQFGPLRVLEIGTYAGTSACHLAYANTGGLVRTIDCDPAASSLAERCKQLCRGLLDTVTADSLEYARTTMIHLAPLPFDVLFIDGLHTAAQVSAEYVAYRPFVRDAGLIFFDDLDLGDMGNFWNSVAYPKIRLDSLHYTGFGCCRVERV
jgi:predicted O-methyltransferase YrrM